MLEAGAIPFRIVGSRPEFLLVTSRRGQWIFPKGRVAPERSIEEAAVKEVAEEAGVVGRLLPGPVGTYRHQKGEKPCQVILFLLAVEAESEHWRESGQRARRWCSFELAAELLEKKRLRELLARAHERIAAEFLSSPGRERT